MSAAATASRYYKNAAEAAAALELSSAQVLYRRVRLDQVEGVLRLKEEGMAVKRKKHGSLKFIRGALALREAPVQPQPTTTVDPADDPLNPRNWK